VDKVGTYEKHRVVIYVDAGALKLLYCFLDGWAKWRLLNPTSENDPPLPEAIHLSFHTALDSKLEFKTDDHMENEVTVVK
jgi:hypothetical protein